MDEALRRRFNWASLPLIATVARLLCRELTLQNEYLRLENQILRSRIKGRIRFSDAERRSLVDAALAMGRGLMRKVVAIVKLDTILAWPRRLEQRKWDCSKRRRRPGRPRKPAEVEELVCRMARENGWGYRRIQGELKKLGIPISKSCVADILRRNDLPRAPERGGLTWREFLPRHADVLLCADLFTKEGLDVLRPSACLRAVCHARQECLDHLILFGIKSLRRAVRCYQCFSNDCRPHQGIDNRVPNAVRADQPIPEAADGPVGKVHCEEFLGGLLKSYHRVAA